LLFFAQILHTKPFHFSPYFLSRATIWFAPNAVAPGLQPIDFLLKKTMNQRHHGSFTGPIVARAGHIVC
jgi:hypothetical protein